MNRLTIVTLGTGGEAFLTRGVERALQRRRAWCCARAATPWRISQEGGRRL